MSRSQPHSSPKPIPTAWLILLLAALCLVLVTSIVPADVAWATPPQQGGGTVPGGQHPSHIPGIPEPATITLVSLGVGALAGYVWRRRKTDKKPPEE